LRVVLGGGRGCGGAQAGNICQPPLQLAAAGRRAPSVGEGVAGDDQQPGKRLLGQFIDPTPRHEEDIGHDVLRGVRVGVAQRVGEDARGALVESLLEAKLGGARDAHNT